MTNFFLKAQQDTLPGRNVITNDAALQKLKPVQFIKQVIITDTTSFCPRNIIADVTFYDPNNLVTQIENSKTSSFPFVFIEKTRRFQTEKKASLVKHLRTGQNLPSQPLHEDWIIGIILISAFLYAIIRSATSNKLPGITRFFLFRGINDPSSRDIGGIFYWQSTILNLISFLIIALFTFCAASNYNLIPSGIRDIYFWGICLGVIVIAVTLRHIVCIITGYASGEKEVFTEYLIGVYQFYKFTAIFLFAVVILMSYTVFLPVSIGIVLGGIVLGIMYLIRILRLLLIFINRNISIFYLILYLCGLEILPVLISIKYFSGLV